jgi:hypothetical protein
MLGFFHTLDEDVGNEFCVDAEFVEIDDLLDSAVAVVARGDDIFRARGFQLVRLHLVAGRP